MKPNEFIVEVDFTEDEERISVDGRNIEIPQVVFLKPVKEWFEPDPNPGQTGKVCRKSCAASCARWETMMPEPRRSVLSSGTRQTRRKSGSLWSACGSITLARKQKKRKP